MGAAASLLGAVAISCAPRPAASAATPSLVTANLSAPLGTTLVEACTPTGPELCFNAVDDNCNGVIDEGCGEQTGLLQFVIAWSASAADVNITLVTPGNERVPSDHGRSTAAGFHLDRDCPGEEGCGGQNFEDIYYDGADPPRGRYEVEIALVDLHGAEPPIAVRFGARLGSRAVGFDAELSPGDHPKKFTFDIP